jgi:hypothetical protein
VRNRFFIDQGSNWQARQGWADRDPQACSSMSPEGIMAEYRSPVCLLLLKGEAAWRTGTRLSAFHRRLCRGRGAQRAVLVLVRLGNLEHARNQR